MAHGLEVFHIHPEQLKYNVEEAKKVLESKLDPRWIKERQQGNTTLSYIGGHTVIRLLNKAFNYQWSFEIVSEEIVQSIPKQVTQWNPQTRKKEPAFNPDGTPKLEPQPPVAKVLGRLTVPGLGVREQYGSKILVGGATEQESAFKAAATDALKKCASMFGIGLELYGDDEGFDGEESNQPASQSAQPVTPPVQTTPPVQPNVPPVQQASPQPSYVMQWDPEDIQRLKDLKAILGITDNNQLNPYVEEFLDTKGVTFNHITPSNIKAFNIFMAKKAESL